MKEPEYKSNGYKAGKFHYTIDGRHVIVTKDTSRSIESVAMYTYTDEDAADNAAYRMARMQANA